MRTKYKLEIIDWDHREEELEEYTKEGWEPIAISKIDSVIYHVSTIIVLFKKKVG